MSDEHHWILPSELLENSPSRRDGVSANQEKIYRFKTTWFMEEVGQSIGSELRKQYRLVVSTACVLFHRFFAFHSFRKHNRFLLGMTCLFLAGKVEEQPAYVETVAAHYCRVRARLTDTDASATSTSATAAMAPNKEEVVAQIKVLERALLHTLCFDLVVRHPHSDYRKLLPFLKERGYLTPAALPPALDAGGLGQVQGAAEALLHLFQVTALRMLNDSCRTMLCLEVPPTHIAVAGVYLTLLRLKLRVVVPDPDAVDAEAEVCMEEAWYRVLLRALAAGGHSTPAASAADLPRGALRRVCDSVLDSIEFLLTQQQPHRSPATAAGAGTPTPAASVMTFGDIDELRGLLEKLAAKPAPAPGTGGGGSSSSSSVSSAASSSGIVYEPVPPPDCASSAVAAPHSASPGGKTLPSNPPLPPPPSPRPSSSSSSAKSAHAALPLPPPPPPADDIDDFRAPPPPLDTPGAGTISFLGFRADSEGGSHDTSMPPPPPPPEDTPADASANAFAAANTNPNPTPAATHYVSSSAAAPMSPTYAGHDESSPTMAAGAPLSKKRHFSDECLATSTATVDGSAPPTGGSQSSAGSGGGGLSSSLSCPVLTGVGSKHAGEGEGAAVAVPTGPIGSTRLEDGEPSSKRRAASPTPGSDILPQ